VLWDIPYIVEILTPKRRGHEPLQEDGERFTRGYRHALEAGCGVSIPDNPLGNPRFTALETFEHLGLKADPERTLLNLNTFHDKNELDRLLDRAAEQGLRYLLGVRGDGSPDLPKLQPSDLGVDAKMVTSIELLTYINERYGGMFCTGAAFNQYKPESFEFRKLDRKRAAGARFIVTQPVMGRDRRVEWLIEGGAPVIVEAWMWPKIELFLKSVKAEVRVDLDGFDPVRNLIELHRAYPECSVYLSMLNLSGDWKALLPRLEGGYNDKVLLQ